MIEFIIGFIEAITVTFILGGSLYVLIFIFTKALDKID